jgi:putative transposase
MCYLGAKKIRNKLIVDDGVQDISIEKVRSYMAEMGICAVYPHKKTSISDKKAIKFPYLLRNMEIWLPNMVWSVDITYIKMNKGHMYLTAIIDWFSRMLLNWELSDTLEAAPVLQCVEKSFKTHGYPIIVNSDQGSQFTSKNYMELLGDYRVKQSMNGKGRWIDNRRIERWFRSLKVENIYIVEYKTPRELRNGVNDYILEYNTQRPHESLEYNRPEVFHNSFFSNKYSSN